MTTSATSASTSFSTSLTLRFASPSLDNINALNITILHKFRRKLLRNYTSWCSYLGKKSNIWGVLLYKDERIKQFHLDAFCQFCF
ncbi:hypothetical protein ACB098_04G060200 [Castanea mollissima]